MEPIMQIGYLVPDLDEAVAAWHRQSGIGPWRVFRGVELAGTCRGDDVRVVIDVALSYSGETQIELIEAKSDAPSPYHREDGAPILGLHHVARITEDLAGEIARADERGQRLLFTGAAPGTEVAYFESPAMPNTILEYISGPHTRAMLAAGVAEARDWDGVELFR